MPNKDSGSPSVHRSPVDKKLTQTTLINRQDLVGPAGANPMIVGSQELKKAQGLKINTSSLRQSLNRSMDPQSEPMSPIFEEKSA